MFAANMYMLSPVSSAACSRLVETDVWPLSVAKIVACVPSCMMLPTRRSGWLVERYLSPQSNETCPVQTRPWLLPWHRRKRVLPLSLRAPRNVVSATFISRRVMSAFVLHRPLMPVSTYCVPLDSTYCTKASGVSTGGSRSPPYAKKKLLDTSSNSPALPPLTQGLKSRTSAPSCQIFTP